MPGGTQGSTAYSNPISTSSSSMTGSSLGPPALLAPGGVAAAATASLNRPRAPPRSLSRPSTSGLSGQVAPRSSASAISPGADPSDDSDGESSGVSSEDDQPEPFPLPLPRPSDPIGALRHDTVKALWRPKNTSISRTSIATSFADFSALVKTLKDRWDEIGRADTTQTQSAEVIKSRGAHQRRLIATWVSAALEYGHPMTLNQLRYSSPPSTFSSLITIVVDLPSRHALLYRR